MATPIGNLGDISRRALETLAAVDVIASESVEATRKLLSACSIAARVTSYREAGRESSGTRLLDSLRGGGTVALVSEAGTPGISDPGRDLVARCHEAGIPVRCIPGASALICAVASSGLPGRRLVFEGFLPRKPIARRAVLQQIAAEERTIVLYVPPHQLTRTLEELVQALGGGRRAFLAREMTKRYEESVETSLQELRDLYLEREPRGEYVLVLAPGEPRSEEPADEELDQEIGWLQQQGLGVGQIAGVLSRYRGWSRNRIYRRATSPKDAAGRRPQP